LDDGLAMLEQTLRDLGGTPLPALCDALLDRLLPPGADDDVALLALRLRERGPGAVSRRPAG
ncbi:MAG: putative sensor protein, partial [Frankiales bacterium]|nr:putative sensor protein [Frankiales bacterium]